ncbi:HD-GYP domain-containing protein [Paenibacillus aestuarii]|uniref:HD-GYP domain-containing protein n=1 Tax=Paenibacillus aestuarii TaxID=516965 RepID=A0ABW0K0D5_9BACL|nr:HD domain-containing phosphohydrolase [Paenibacillus aestuarii]
MRMIDINAYDERTMVLAKPVYDTRGRILIGSGRVLHARLVERLLEMGITCLMIEDEQSTGITLDDMLDMPSWLEQIQLMQLCYQTAKDKKVLMHREVFACAGKLLNEVKTRKMLLPMPASMIPKELQLYAHVVNVTIWALLTGVRLGYNELQLRDLAVGCLLHDIGKVLDADPANHPEAGFNFIKTCREVSLIAAHLAFQHHERLDGTGHPRAIEGTAFHPFAQVCGMANLFEAKISDGSLAPHEAIEYLMSLSGKRFTVEHVRAFVSAVPAYLPGMNVRMNNGREALVFAITSHLQRPVIRYQDTNEVVNLAENLSVLVTQII